LVVGGHWDFDELEEELLRFFVSMNSYTSKDGVLWRDSADIGCVSDASGGDWGKSGGLFSSTALAPWGRIRALPSINFLLCA
jgi:hypothetical protein